MAVRFARNRARFIAIASRSRASAVHSDSKIAFGNSIAGLTPRLVPTSTISYCSAKSVQRRKSRKHIPIHRNRDMLVLLLVLSFLHKKPDALRKEILLT
jgi:hypothetical protein